MLLNTQKMVETNNTQDDLQEIIYRISHDMGAPLRHIYNFSSLLSANCQQQLDSDALLWLDYVQNSTQKAQAMLEGLLSYSRIFNTQQAAEIFDLNKVWETVLVENNSIIQQTQAQIDAQPLPELSAILQHWKILMSALLANSLLYQVDNQRPVIKLSYERPNDSLFGLIIQDNGIGVDEKNYTELTAIFRRLHTDDEYPGAGMGLAICQRIMHYYGGSIEFGKSELGGLKVSCSMPVTID